MARRSGEALKRGLIVLTGFVGLLLVAQAQAAPVTYTFRPYDGSGQTADIADLDHHKFYVWEINNFALASDQHVVGATLTFTNIYDWQNESNDRLYTHLMDNTPSTLGLTPIKWLNKVDADLRTGSNNVTYYNTRLLRGTDNQGGGDNFSGIGTLVAPVWSDPVGGLPSNNVVYDFARLGGSVDAAGNIVAGSLNILATVEAYLRSGNNLSFGFDPDCHYYNDRVTFTVTTDTTPVPESGTMVLLGSGLLGLAGFARRRRKTD